MFINLKIYSKIVDCINVSIISLILFLLLISLNNQSKWTMFYSSMIELRNKNNNLIDYISKTEQYFLNEIEHQHNIKNTKPDDLVYVIKTKTKKRTNFLSKAIKEMRRGFADGTYQRGY